MALTLGSLTGDTLTAFGNWMGDIVQTFAAEAETFVLKLHDNSEVDFSQVGLPDQLNYLQWDYDVELAQLRSINPSFITPSTSVIDAAGDSLAALAVPVSPTLLAAVPAFPTQDVERPTVNLPATPGTNVGEAPGDAPVVTEYATPDAPTITLPSVPTFEELQIPAAPSFSIPSFAQTAPTFNLAPPTAQFDFVDDEYVSVLHDPLVTKLLTDLENGGYGIEADDEAALWARARDRAESAARVAVDNIMRQAVQTSFPMPQGALFAQLEKARADAISAMQEANREIALKRADMYVENRKFTIQEVRQYEQILRNFFIATQERMLNAAKAAVELSLAVYDASVRNFSAQLESYRVGAQVFETRIRAELAKAEVYKAQIEAENLRGQFNKLRTDVYVAQLTGIRTNVDLYKSRLEAVDMLSRIQAQKVEIFRTRVQAYAMKVQAKAAEYDMYKAAVQGETAKLDVYKTDIQAYESKVRTEEARVRSLTAANEATIAQYKARLAQYQATLDSRAKVVDARTESEKLRISALNANVSSYRALADAVIAGVTARKDAQRMNNEWNIAAVNSRVEITRQRLEQLKSTVANRTTIDKAGAEMFMTAMSAAITTVSGLSVKTAT